MVLEFDKKFAEELEKIDLRIILSLRIWLFN